MSSSNWGGPAFPVPIQFNQHGDIHEHGDTGMSLRDAFAIAALQGSLACPEAPSFNGVKAMTPEATAQFAYAVADAMLERRLK